MKSLLFLMVSIMTVSLVASGGNALAEDGGFCRSMNSNDVAANICA